VRRGRPRHDDILTPREWEVLALLRQGLNNEAIAQRLGISLDTAKFHVSEILGKLGVSSREEAARWEGEPRRGWVILPLWLKWPLAAGALAGIVALIFVAAGALGGSNGDNVGRIATPSGDEFVDFEAMPAPTARTQPQLGQVNELQFSVCVDDESWQRPTVEEQIAQLATDDPTGARYGGFNDGHRNQFEASFWAPPAGADPMGFVIEFSGLWTIGEKEILSSISRGCPTLPSVNNLDLLDIWLFGYEAKAAQSETSRLVVIVDKRSGGFAVIQVRLPGPVTDYAGAICFMDASGKILGRVEAGSFSSVQP
jgi:DNA-binding CsgD family transcriptional regulator